MANYDNHTRLLTEGSVWLDEKKRTIVIFRVIWANTVNVGEFELLVIPDMKLSRRKASEIEKYVRAGKLQYCKECLRD